MSIPSSRLFSPVLVAGCLVIAVGFAIRGSFGVFQIPIAAQFGWPRADFSLAIAIQNLAWGIGQPIFGALAEKLGDRRAIFLGAVFYAGGLFLSSLAYTPLQHQMLEFVVGFGIAGTGFGVILAMVGRAASDANRSMALAVVTAAGSVGQILGAPIAAALLARMQWSGVFVIFAVAILAAMAVLPMMKGPARASRAELEESMGRILGKAFRDPTYTMIFLGFFSCGYQLSFISAHFPAMVTEMCGAIDPTGTLAALGVTSTAALGAVSISLIGMANVAGTLSAGWLGKRYSRKYLLSSIYLARTVVGAAFILMPVTPVSVVLFSVAMGSLWLATVPLTSGLVAHVYGLRYMGTLYGIVFFSHQLGSFLGVWLGGRLYDLYGSYAIAWWVGLGIGLFSAVIHLPIREQPLSARMAAA
jgi:MFS family permease